MSSFEKFTFVLYISTKNFIQNFQNVLVIKIFNNIVVRDMGRADIGHGPFSEEGTVGSSGTLQEPVHDFADHPLHGRGGLSRQQNRHHEQGKNKVLR